MASLASSEKLFKVEIIAEQDRERVLQFLKQHYYGQGPLSEYLNREANDESAVEEGIHNSLYLVDEGLSVMATTSAEEIVGVALNAIFRKNEAPENSIQCNENTAKILNLLNQLKMDMVGLGKYQKLDENGMTAQILAVHPEWRNKAIGSASWKRTREIAEQRGFKQMQSTCSNAYSARILEKLGFECIHAIKYEDYKVNGKVVVNPNPPHTHIKYMVLKI